MLELMSVADLRVDVICVMQKLKGSEVRRTRGFCPHSTGSYVRESETRTNLLIMVLWKVDERVWRADLPNDVAAGRDPAVEDCAISQLLYFRSGVWPAVGKLDGALELTVETSLGNEVGEAHIENVLELCIARGI